MVPIIGSNWNLVRNNYYTLMVMNLFVIILMAFSLLFSFSVKADEGKGGPVEISLSTMILFSLDESPDINIAREKRDQMVYFSKEAASGYYPRVEFSATGGREYVAPTTAKNANNVAKSSVTLNQTLFDGHQTYAEVQRREELKRTADIDLDLKKSEIILLVTNNYLSILRYSKLVERTQVFVDSIDGIVSNIADMVEAGAAGKVMLDYAKSRQAAASIVLNEARSSLNDSISNLEYLTGPLPEFTAIPPDYLEPNKLDKEFYIDTAATDSSVMNRVESEIDAMKMQLEAEEGGFYPSVDFAMKAEQTHDDGGDNGRLRDLKATVSLTYDIFDGFEKKNRYKRVSSQLSELEHKEQKVFDELKRDIDLSYNQISSIQRAMVATNSEIYSNAALQSLNQDNFRLGEINAIELIEGEERVQNAYARKYKLEYDLYTNIYTLLINSSIIKERYFCETCGDDDEL